MELVVVGYVAVAIAVTWWTVRLRVDAPGTPVSRALTAVVLGAVWPFTLLFALENAWLGWVPGDVAVWVPAVMTATVPLAALGALVGATVAGTPGLVAGALVGLALGVAAARWLVRTRRGPYAE